MVIFFLSLIGLSQQFNLDTQAVHIVKNENGLFGFSVVLHNTSSEELILIGSPHAQTNQGPGVVEGGAVYKCAIPRLDEQTSTPVVCDSVINAFTLLDGGNPYYDDSGFKSYEEDDFYHIPAANKSKQYLGVSLAASDKFVVVCAHRYEHRFWLPQYKDDLARQLVGRCLVTNADMDEDFMVRDFVPCDNYLDSGYEFYGYCQAGTSMALDNDNLLIGAPGRNKAIGGAFLYDLSTQVNEPEEMMDISVEQDQGDYTQYIGYSSVICNMDGYELTGEGENGLEMIFGSPRGGILYRGEVRIFSTKNPNGQSHNDNGQKVFDSYFNYFDPSYQYNFVGEQMGSYFGSSLACVDVNGDGLDDLIVGAPWYTSYEADINADTGRVYVMYGSDELENTQLLEEPVKITGDQPNAAFGFSMAAAGDMNDDGFNDLFVGAPYHDDGQGAVFLYLGGPLGLQTTTSQVLKPSALNVLDGLLTFGWSISGGRDVDGNGYPDVAIGAYKSGHVVFIRSKSVIDVEPTLELTLTELSDTDLVTSVQVCMQYKPRPDVEALTVSSIPVKFTITLDTDTAYSRLSFSEVAMARLWVDRLTVSTVELDKMCTGRKDIHFDNSTGNVQPMLVSVSAVIDDPTLTSIVLNEEIIRDAVRELTVQSECHPVTGICNVDMTVAMEEEVQFEEAALYPAVVFGYVDTFTQRITVRNVGTAQYNYAYNAAVRITYPTDIRFSSVSRAEGLSTDVSCREMQGAVLCKLPDDGPINKGDKTQTFGLEFGLKDIKNPVDLPIRAEVYVEEPTVDANNYNDIAINVVPIKELADVMINGGSTQQKVPFNNQYTIVNRAIGTTGVDIKHEYIVELNEFALQNYVSNISVRIYWPQQLPESDLYIVPLYNISTRTPADVQVYCRPNVEDLYPEAVGETPALKITDDLALPEQRAVASVPGSFDCREDRSACQEIYCNIETIRRGAAFYNGFKISLYGRVHEANLYDSPGMNITSFATLSGVMDGMILPLKRSTSATSVLYPSTVKSRNWLWVIIGAIIGGLLLLFLLILALWKCGFFKRAQPPSVKADKVDEQIDMHPYGQ